MTNESSKAKAPRVTRGHALDDLDFTEAEVLEIQVKAQIYRDLMKFIRSGKLSQKALASTLDLHQPDVSNLLNGKISKFSMSKLIQMAGKLDLQAEIKLVKPRRAKLVSTQTSRASRAA